MKVKELWHNVGKFEIDRERLLERQVEVLKAISEKAWIIDAEVDIVSGNIIYTALSKEFDEVNLGDMIPFYEVEIKIERDDFGREIENVDVEFIKED